MPAPVKPPARPYDARRRRAAAARTRRAILDAARRLFLERGYAATTMADVADAAGVALDTVYAAAGRKPVLFRLLIETAISGEVAPVPALERGYVRAVAAAPDAGSKIDRYVEALPAIHARLAPLLQVLRSAAESDGELAAVWQEIAERRAANMRLFAAELASTGQLRAEVSLSETADVIWATNSPELYLLLVHERGWAPERYARWLADSWHRLLLRDP